MRTRIFFLFIILLLLLVGCQGLSGEPQIVATLPPPPTAMQISAPQYAPDLLLGAQIYAANCTRCHGANGQGDGELVLSGEVPAIVDFTDPATIVGKTPEDYFVIITQGKLDRLMPPWAGSLTEMERWSAAMYVYGLSGGETIAQAATALPPQPQTTEQAETTEEVALTGDLTGSITNGTAGAAVPGGLAVTLHVIDAEFNNVRFETIADAGGSFRFAGVPLRADRQYLASVEINGVGFVSPLITLDPALGTASLPITIYEAGADASAIQVDGMMTQISVTQAEMQILQIVRFVNTSDRVYFSQTNTQPASVMVSVPQGAQYRDVMGSEYVLSADGTQVYDVQPIIPGSPRLMHLSYSMPYSAGATLIQTMPYGLNGRYELLIETHGLALVGDTLIPQGAITVGNTPMSSYAAEINLSAGEMINLGINGSPASSLTAVGATSSSNPFALVLIGIGIGALGVAGVLFVQDRLKAAAVTKPVYAANDLVKQIAELDVQHRDGKVSGKVYERKRASLKAQLTTILKDQ